VLGMMEQLHTCWSSPMWQHQLVSLMTPRPAPVFDESMEETTSPGVLAARVVNAAKSAASMQHIMNAIADGSNTFDTIAKYTGRPRGSIEHALKRMQDRGIVTFDQPQHRGTRYWRAA